MTDDDIQAHVVPLDPEQVALDAMEAERIRLEIREQERRLAYAAEADPLFFKWQRGEGTEQEWLDKVAEVRARYSTTT